MSNLPLYIDQPAQLAAFCTDLKGHEFIALDSEFIRDKTYYPRLCLLQVASEHRIACIDPLALDDLDPLIDLLFDRSIIKVLHAAQQDMEIFFHLRGELPAPVFDTQIAAALLGSGEQLSYAALVQSISGVTLDKSQTRTDWSLRPLSTQQLDYAAADVRYLPAIYLHQRRLLEAGNRLGWLSEDFDALTDPQRYRPGPQQAWRRIKGHGRLRGIQLPVLRALAAWREQEAMRLDKPRRWIIGDDILLDIARQMPATQFELQRIHGYRDYLKTYTDTFLALIRSARQEPQEQWPVLTKQMPLTTEQEILFDVLLAIVRLRAAQYELEPAHLSGRKDLEKIVQNPDADIALFHGWRAAMAGHDIAAFLAGRQRLTVKDQRLMLETTT